MTLIDMAAGHYLIAVGGNCRDLSDPTGASCAGAGQFKLELLEGGLEAFITAASTVRFGSIVTLDGSTSFDPNFRNSELTFQWKQDPTDVPQVTLSDPAAVKPTFTTTKDDVGKTLHFTLTVTNPTGESSTKAAAIAITQDNNPPTVSIIAQPVLEGRTVTLNATVSDPDADGDKIASYRWEQLGGPVVQLDKVDGKSLSFTAPSIGTGSSDLTFSLTVTDDYAANPKSATATATVSVNNDPNLLDCAGAKPSKSELWPPKKKLVPITIDNITGPNPPSLTITKVTSDEPTRNPAAKDNTKPDVKIKKGKITRKSPQAVDKLWLRAERQKLADGSENGRYYTIQFTANDGTQTCTGKVGVEVRSNKAKPAVDDGPMSEANRKN